MNSIQAAMRERVRKTYVEGTHRTITPTDTVKRISPYLDALGITRVANVTGLDWLNLPVTMVVRPNSRGVSVSQGKGQTVEAAIASGLMESIECHHAENIVKPVYYSRACDLQQTLQLANVSALPITKGSVFHEHLPVMWIEGFDLISKTAMWVPYSVVHTDYTVPSPPASGIFFESSSGLASGNHLLEAACHGICELIERDAITLKKIEFAARPEVRKKYRIATDSIRYPVAKAFIAHCLTLGLKIEVIDCTSDLNIPVFECVIRQIDERKNRRLYNTVGFGCHPNSDIALMRALTEAAQSRLTMISGSRDDAGRDIYRRFQHPIVENSTEVDSEGVKSLQSVPSRDFKTFNEELEGLLKTLLKKDVTQVIVVDLTKEMFQIPVVRVVIPGLESMGPGTEYAHLYEPGMRAKALIRTLSKRSRRDEG